MSRLLSHLQESASDTARVLDSVAFKSPGKAKLSGVLSAAPSPLPSPFPSDLRTPSALSASSASLTELPFALTLSSGVPTAPSSVYGNSISITGTDRDSRDRENAWPGASKPTLSHQRSASRLPVSCSVAADAAELFGLSPEDVEAAEETGHTSAPQAVGGVGMRPKSRAQRLRSEVLETRVGISDDAC